MSILSFKNSCFSFTAASFKSGKINNITARSSGLFACEKITFEEPFSGGKQVKVLVVIFVIVISVICDTKGKRRIYIFYSFTKVGNIKKTALDFNICISIT